VDLSKADENISLDSQCVVLASVPTVCDHIPGAAN